MREGTELICCKFSRSTKDYLQLSSAISLLSVRQLQHVDTSPRLQNVDAISGDSSTGPGVAPGGDVN